MEQCYSCAASVGYRSVIITKCARGGLRDLGAQPSATAKSTALNAADSGHSGESARFDG